MPLQSSCHRIKAAPADKMSFLLAIFTCLLLCGARGHDDEESKAVKYSGDSFNLGLATNNHFVMFYAPWCGHCTRLSPTWEKLAEDYNDASTETDVIIAKVDCTAETALCSEHDVTGYPTLKFFKAGHDEGTKYRGGRDYEALKSYISEQLGKAAQEPAETQEEPKVPAPVSGLVELTEETFDNYVATGNHFIKFYAPWCGYCKKLVPTWEKLAESLHFSTNVRVSQVDCTEHKDVCQRFEVKGYPTLLWIVDGQKASVEKYSGDRSIEDLKSYVSRQLGVDLVEAPEEIPSISNPVVQLSRENFEHVVEKGMTFVKFFAPWCGHCKRMSPTWDELGSKFLGSGQVTIGKVDCTLDINKDLCKQQEVRGYPSIYLYKDGERVDSYEGNRQLEDMYLFVLKHLQQKDEL
ncbi:hypothetical protein FOCC_FOCC014887 [Frankliniella occidentalis]|nr:hypothetical protein FOCC_FOCC014887 [Frankliniella occidentalis]